MKEGRISPADDARLTAYAFGELPDEEVAAVEALLREDPAARETVAGLRRMAERLGSALASEPVPEQRVLAVASQSRQSTREKPTKTPLFWGSLGLAATLAVVTGVALYSRLSPGLPAAKDSLTPVQMASFDGGKAQPEAPAVALEEFSVKAPPERAAVSGTISRAFQAAAIGGFAAPSERSGPTPASIVGRSTGKGEASQAQADLLPAAAPFSPDSRSALVPIQLSLDPRLSPGSKVHGYIPDPKFVVFPPPSPGTALKDPFVVPSPFSGDPRFVIWAVPLFPLSSSGGSRGGIEGIQAALRSANVISTFGATLPLPQTTASAKSVPAAPPADEAKTKNPFQR